MNDSEICALVARSEIAGLRCGVEAARRVSPSVGVSAFDIGGGFAAFTGIDSPFSQALGLGAFAPVTQADVDQLSAFYGERGSTSRIAVEPTGGRELPIWLERSGYIPGESEAMLVSMAPWAPLQRTSRVAPAADLEAWIRASAIGFVERDSPDDADLTIPRILATSENVHALEIRENGAVVATAAMDLHDECATLFAGSTLPGFRRRGFHGALIAARIERARRLGARLLRATAKPGSGSERNFHRYGFAVLYTRVLWERAL